MNENQLATELIQEEARRIAYTTVFYFVDGHKSCGDLNSIQQGELTEEIYGLIRTATVTVEFPAVTQ